MLKLPIVIVQVLGMAIATVFFAALGFLNPANRGSLMVGVILFFLFMGVIGGYTAARTHKVRVSLATMRTAIRAL